MRDRIKHVKLYGRLSENNMKKEELEFVEEQLESLSKSQLVRRAIKTLYKHETGQLYNEVLQDIKHRISTTKIYQETEDKDLYEELNKTIDNIGEFGKGE